jgi:hypothetical protein
VVRGSWQVQSAGACRLSVNPTVTTPRFCQQLRKLADEFHVDFEDPNRRELRRNGNRLTFNIAVVVNRAVIVVYILEFLRVL